MDLKQAYNFFNQAWQLYKKYHGLPPSDDYWNDLAQDAHDLGEESGSRFCKDLILAVINELEREGCGTE